MKKISKKQSKKNNKLKIIKESLEKVCFICRQRGNTLAHILPRSLFPEHYSNPLNIIILCIDCHTLFDDNLKFRQQQINIYERVKSFDEIGATRYFKF